MNQDSLPRIIEPEHLQTLLGQPGMVIVDLGKADNYRQAHVPGAVFLEYPQIIRVEKPVMGLLPDAEQLSRVLSGLGIDESTHVIAYDDEGGGKAGRLLWTLDVIGHQRYSLLDGGIVAWANEGFPLQREIVTPTTVNRQVTLTDAARTDKAWILEHLDDPNVVLLDTRTPEEFTGAKKFSERGGHIPGAVNFNWVEAMDPNRNLRLRSDDELRGAFEKLGVTPDKQVVVYCQSHHRSAHTYNVLRHLGYDNVRGYPGAWSDWGNDPDTPVET